MQQLKFLETAVDPEVAAQDIIAQLANRDDPLCLDEEKNEWVTSTTGGC